MRYKPPKALLKKAESLKRQGRLLEVARADFGVLFRQMDAFVVHGGLFYRDGVTLETLKAIDRTTLTPAISRAAPAGKIYYLLPGLNQIEAGCY